MDKKIAKFESKGRLEELKPKNTLIKAGFKEGMSLCDIGAGTGVFSFPAAEISNSDIYALDISDKMLQILKEKTEKKETKNIKIKKVESKTLPLDDDSCDMAIMVTVLHEIEDKKFMMNEIKRILKDKGRFMVIEFHKRESLMGPPVEYRLSSAYVEEFCDALGFQTVDKFSLGENLYSIVFQL